MSNNDHLFTDADVIFSYTRADALRDGVLIELPTAKTWGFKVSVAITQGAYAECIAWNEPDPKLEETQLLPRDSEEVQFGLLGWCFSQAKC